MLCLLCHSFPSNQPLGVQSHLWISQMPGKRSCKLPHKKNAAKTVCHELLNPASFQIISGSKPWSDIKARSDDWHDLTSADKLSCTLFKSNVTENLGEIGWGASKQAYVCLFESLFKCPTRFDVCKYKGIERSHCESAVELHHKGWRRQGCFFDSLAFLTPTRLPAAYPFGAQIWTSKTYHLPYIIQYFWWVPSQTSKTYETSPVRQTVQWILPTCTCSFPCISKGTLKTLTRAVGSICKV